MATTSSSPGRSPRRKNVEKRGIYRARGNLSSGEYIFLRETEGSTLTCVARLPRDTPIYRLYNGSRPNTHLRTARMRNQYRDSVCPDSGQFSDWIRAYNLLHRWLLFINRFVETIFDLVSWESAIFLSLTRTVDSPCHDNVSYLFDRYLYVSDNSGMLGILFFRCVLLRSFWITLRPIIKWNAGSRKNRWNFAYYCFGNLWSFVWRCSKYRTKRVSTFSCTLCRANKSLVIERPRWLTRKVYYNFVEFQVSCFFRSTLIKKEKKFRV